jgi:uncharacterized repeat protein (TIGR01451 family)
MSRLTTSLALLFLVVLTPLAANAQRAWSDGPPVSTTAAAPKAPPADRLAAEASSFLTFYANRAAFKDDFEVLIEEDFDDVNAPPGSFCNSPSPVNVLTDNACVGLGDVAPDLEVAAVGPNQGSPTALFAAGPGFLGNATTVVGANFFSDATALRFDPPVQAVAFNTYSSVVGRPYTVSVFSGSGAFLGGTTYTSAGLSTPRFVGVASDEVIIGEVRVDDGTTSDGALVDSVGIGRGCKVALSATLDDDTIMPGQTVTFTITVTNLDTVPAAVDLELGVLLPIQRRIAFGSGTLPPNFTVTRNVRLRVPNLLPSGHFLALLNLFYSGGEIACDTEAFEGTISAPRAESGAGSTDTAFAVLAPEGDLFAASAAGTGAPTLAVRPNPFTHRTTVAFEIAEASAVRLAVYDVLGREVAVLVDREVEAGRHEAVFDARGLAPGVYVYRLTAGGAVRTGRMTLAR